MRSTNISACCFHEPASHSEDRLSIHPHKAHLESVGSAALNQLKPSKPSKVVCPRTDRECALHKVASIPIRDAFSAPRTVLDNEEKQHYFIGARFTISIRLIVPHWSALLAELFVAHLTRGSLGKLGGSSQYGLGFLLSPSDRLDFSISSGIAIQDS